MKDTLERAVPFFIIAFFAAFFSPFVQAQDYQVSPNSVLSQTYVSSGNVNNGFTFFGPAYDWSGVDWKVILAIILIPAVLYTLWRLIKYGYSIDDLSRASARGYNISYHDIYRGRRKKSLKLKK